MMIHQLRVYEIFAHNKSAFHDRFRDHAARIMKTYGFDIMATWESPTESGTEFVYLLAWPDERTMTDSWQRFRADDEWKRVKQETNAKHGDLVGKIQEKTLVPTSYSPKMSRSNQTHTRRTRRAQKGRKG